MKSQSQKRSTQGKRQLLTYCSLLQIIKDFSIYLPTKLVYRLANCAAICADPKYENSSRKERDDMTYIHYCNRIERVPTYIRPPVKYAIARYLYGQGWIGKPLLDEIVASHRPQLTESLYIEDNEEIATDTLPEV
ncbi:hypothetical protein G6F37_000825 [Rhizopus arrhizus]|nr:hypothetical protein G6F38_004303 [Rhizopus arrhizus]KAG1163856.1 hypothetical protein G6F37_000825 [Rhizopus arrhizus]